MKEIIEEIVKYAQENSIEIIKIFLTIVGAIIGLLQWKKSNDYKRADVTKMLISQIRDDKEIANIIELLDWEEGIEYDQKFHINDEKVEKLFEDDQQLFIAIDRTLAHFNYICYLKRLKIFHRKDMAVFQYATRRLLNNKEISNYLHTLLYWTAGQDVDCSYKYLIRYGIKMEWLSKDFLNHDSKEYIDYLNSEPVKKIKLLLHVYA